MSTEFTDFGSGDIIEADHIKQTFDPIGDLENGAAWYRSSDPASPANTYKVSFASGNVVDAYSRGLLVHLKAHASNLGPSTLIITGPSGDLAPMELTKKGGQPLEEGDIVENQVVSVVFTEDLDENDNVIGQRFEVIGGIGSGGALSDPAWAIFDVLDTDLTQSDLSGQDLPLGSRLEGEQVSANANHRVELDEGLYSISFSVSCEINSGDALEVGVYDYSGGGGPVQLAGSSVAVVGDEDTHDSPVGHAILSVAEGQTKEIGLRTGTRVVDGTIHAGKGFFKVLKVSGGVASSGSVTNLDGLSDVSIGTVPSDGEILQFDSGIGKFRNTALSVGAVDSVFGRSGDVTAASGDYSASEVSDDSGVTSPAGTVADALTQLNTAISANSTSIGSNTTSLSGKESTSNKNQASGYAGLDGSGLVPPDRGGTGADLSATGGSGQVLKQESVGGAITVSAMSASDIGGGNVSDVEFGHLDGVSGPIQGQLDGKQNPDATLDAISGLTLAKGDLMVHNGTSLQNLSAGSDGQVLQANSAASVGVEWAEPSGGEGVPIGSVMSYAGSSAPSGWLLMYGQAISRTAYADLFAVLGTTYGNGDGSTTFNLPDLRGRVVAGLDNMGGSSSNRLTSPVNGDGLGNSGGSQSHTLSISQMPQHNHSISDPGHRHQDYWDQSVLNYNPGNPTRPYSDYRGGISNYRYNYTSYSTTGISINYAGSGQSHNNVQPTFILNYIIFAGL